MASPHHVHLREDTLAAVPEGGKSGPAVSHLNVIQLNLPSKIEDLGGGSAVLEPRSILKCP